jgi:hypothetical protein
VFAVLRLGAVVACVLALAGVASARAADWTRFDYNAARSGVGPADTGINAGNAHLLGLRVVSVNGTVDSSPVELHDVRVAGAVRDIAIVTTTYGRTLAFDPGNGRRLWEFTPGDIRAYEGSAQITTATPIIDPDRRSVYAASPDGRIHKLLIATGKEIHSGGWPVRVTFDATHEKIASALNISGGSVVVTTGGYIGDAPPYQGHVVMIGRSTGRITGVWNSLCSNRHRLIDPPGSCPASDSAIWGRAGAVVVPGSGRILVATGNGPFNGATDWGDSALELSADGRRLLRHWTPVDQAQLSDSDTDLGSTSPALLTPSLAVQGGKAGVLDLLDLNALPRAGARLGGQREQIEAPDAAEVVTAPVAWSHRGRHYLFVADGSATWAYVLAGGRLRVAWRDGSAGTSPVLAGGLLYVYDPGGRINILEPTSGRTVASLGAGSGHWNSPIVVGGRIIEPTGDANAHAVRGVIEIYHLPGR